MTLTPMSPLENVETKVKMTTEDFDWRNCWYPIAFVVDLPQDRPYGFSIYGEPLVLFRNQEEVWICVTNRCPHRRASLSEGQVIAGRLECLYHGWQFGEQGTCVHIPQLGDNAKIPLAANVTAFPVQDAQGILWVWLGEADLAANTQPPRVDDLAEPGVFVVDTLCDLPYDHSLLVENLLDPAHVYISHDRTEIGIRREQAQPLEMEILSTEIRGICGRFRGTRIPNLPWTRLDFVAPALVHYQFTNKAAGVIGGLALHALPLAPGKSRILVRRYGNIFKPSFRHTPRWLEHLRQNKILEEDLTFIVEQQRYFEQTADSIQSAYLPLNTLDTFVIAHRKWLDQFGQHLPWFQGYRTDKFAPKRPPTPELNQLPSRWERHTQQCHACRTAHQSIQTLHHVSIGVAIALLILGELSEGWIHILSIIGFGTAVITTGVSQQLQQKFEQTYQRHP